MSGTLTPVAAATVAESDQFLPQRKRDGIGLCLSGGGLMSLVLADAVRKQGDTLAGPFRDFDRQVAKPTHKRKF
jgi:hypothetical protein